MTDLEWIKAFTKITLSKVCKENNIDRANLSNNRISKDKITLVKNILEERVNDLNKKYKEELK